jgi:ribosomal protein S11
MFHQTVSKLIDYRKKKKKKKTYMAGYEYAYLMQPFFIKQGIQTFSLKVKGKGAQVRGFFEGLCRNDLLMIQTFYQRTYLAHNGTKTVRKRRL